MLVWQTSLAMPMKYGSKACTLGSIWYCKTMKRQFRSGTVEKIVKTSISLPHILIAFAQEKCASEGFPTLSAYITHLIRTDRGRDEEKRLLLAESSNSHYSSHQPHLNEARETPGAAAPPPTKKKRAA